MYVYKYTFLTKLKKIIIETEKIRKGTKSLINTF